MKLRCCKSHEEKIYTLKEFCPLCNQPTNNAHYKFIKIKDAIEHNIDKSKFRKV